MKRHHHVISLTGLFSVAIMCAFLAGCASPLDKFKHNLDVQGLKPMTGSEMTTAFAGNTMVGENLKHMYSRYYAVDGTAKGRDWGSWGEESATGAWRINNDNLLCSKFEDDWAKNGERCSLVYHVTGNDYTHIIVTGTKPKSNPNGIYVYQIIPGDQSGVQ
jgi:hypothetical protein